MKITMSCFAPQFTHERSLLVKLVSQQHQPVAETALSRGLRVRRRDSLIAGMARMN